MNTTVLDQSIDEAAARFGIASEKAHQLMGIMIALIFHPQRGGFAGFVKLFHSKGQASTIGSWLGPDRGDSIGPSQVEMLFGAALVDAIAGKLRIDRWLTADAISVMLPSLVDELTPDGRAPGNIPDGLKSWVAGIEDWLPALESQGWGPVANGPIALSDAAVGMAGTADAVQKTTTRTKRHEYGEARTVLLWLLFIKCLAGAVLFFTGFDAAS